MKLRARRTPFLGLRAVLLAGLVLAGAGCGGDEASVDTAAAANEAAAQRAVVVRTATPTIQDVEDRASLPAELLALRDATLAAEVSGRVEALSFEVGQRVAAGKTLVSIDTRSLRQAVTEAEAIDRQRMLQHQRAERLFEKRSITQQQLLDAVTNRDVAASRLASAKLELSKSQVRAPWTGSVSQRFVEVGDFVSPGQPIAELVDVNRIKVRAPVPAQDVPLVAKGSQVEVRIDALPGGPPILGMIVRLSPQVDPRTRTLDVEAEIDNPDGRVKPGMPARLLLNRRTLAGAVLVPPAAVIDLGGDDGVFVVEGGIARQRPVTLGPVVGDQVVVLKGLDGTERLVIDGARQLIDGQKVREAAPREEKTQ